MDDTSAVKVVVVVKFRSRLSDDEIRRRYQERMPEFRQLPGLVQKYYVRDEAADEWAGVYLWDSNDSLEKYLSSDLRKSIASAYEVEGAPRVEILSVLDTLRT